MPLDSTNNTGPALDGAAHALASAEARHRAAEQAAAAALAKLEQIHQRIADLETERGDIITRRPGAVMEPDDAGRLALLGADLESLATLRARAEQDLAAAKQPAEAARGAVKAARYTLGRAQSDAELRALADHARTVAAAFHDTLQRLNVLESQLGVPRPTWLPSAEFWTEIRRRGLVAGVV